MKSYQAILAGLALFLLAGCGGPAPYPTPTPVATRWSSLPPTPALPMEFYLSGRQADYEVGQRPEFILMPLVEGVVVQTPIPVTFTLYIPDDAPLQQKMVVHNQPICYACDPLPGDPRPCGGCEYGPYFGHTGSLAFGDFVLDQTGVYSITAASEDPDLVVRDFLFEVTSARINALFLEPEVGGYELAFKQKVDWTAPYDRYHAIYYSHDFAPPRELLVSIDILGDAQETEAQAAHPEMIEIEGHFLVLHPEQKGFTIAWPSAEYRLEIKGFEPYDEHTRPFVKAYLDYYPSDLSP